MFSPPPSPPISTAPALIRKIRLQVFVGDADYLQIFPHIPTERHWRKVCTTPDLPMITEAAVPLKITRLVGRLGLLGSRAYGENVLFSTYVYIEG